MNLTLFFRLILMSIFQESVTSSMTNSRGKMSYGNTYFFSPRVIAKDGFTISLQIHNSNYCESENGYRTLGHTMQAVEFGFPSEDDILLHEYSEMCGSSTYSDEDEEIPFDSNTFSAIGTVGKIPLTILEQLFEKHGGVDWEKTISIEAFEGFTKE